MRARVTALERKHDRPLLAELGHAGAEGSELDDGLLTAGEISQLKLDADWVVLSACNTAAADGTPGAEGLSGLAQAFFYARARSSSRIGR